MFLEYTDYEHEKEQPMLKPWKTIFDAPHDGIFRAGNNTKPLYAHIHSPQVLFENLPMVALQYTQISFILELSDKMLDSELEIVRIMLHRNDYRLAIIDMGCHYVPDFKQWVYGGVLNDQPFTYEYNGVMRIG